MVKIIIPLVCFAMIALGVFIVGWSVYRYVVHTTERKPMK